MVSISFHTNNVLKVDFDYNKGVALTAIFTVNPLSSAKRPIEGVYIMSIALNKIEKGKCVLYTNLTEEIREHNPPLVYKFK